MYSHKGIGGKERMAEKTGDELSCQWRISWKKIHFAWNKSTAIFVRLYRTFVYFLFLFFFFFSFIILFCI